jgi:hypothetical protein
LSNEAGFSVTESGLSLDGASFRPAYCAAKESRRITEESVFIVRPHCVYFVCGLFADFAAICRVLPGYLVETV